MPTALCAFVQRLRPIALPVAVAAVGFLTAPAADAQQRRPSSRTRPAPTAESRQPASRIAPDDVTQVPTMPQPSLNSRWRQPGQAGQADGGYGRNQAKGGQDLGADGAPDGLELPPSQEKPLGPDGKPLPTAQEVNAGNVLIQEAFKKSESAKDEADLSEIIALCTEGIKNKATKENVTYARRLSAWAYNRRGEHFAEMGNEEEALNDFTGAISFDVNHWRAIHNRGVSYATLGKSKEALADFSRALELNRNYANTWFNRAELRADRGEFGRAITDYTEAIRLSPKEAAFYTGRGRSYQRIGRPREAIEDINMAARLDPNDAKARLSRAELYLSQRDFGRAAADYRDAIKLDPNLGSAYLGAAWIMATCPDERYRNSELALSTAQKAMELDGDKDPRYTETLAAAYANAGQYDSAVAMLQTLLEKSNQQQQASIRGRIDLYKSEKPYRDGMPAPQRQATQRQAAQPQPARRPVPR